MSSFGMVPGTTAKLQLQKIYRKKFEPRGPQSGKGRNRCELLLGWQKRVKKTRFYGFVYGENLFFSPPPSALLRVLVCWHRALW